MTKERDIAKFCQKWTNNDPQRQFLCRESNKKTRMFDKSGMEETRTFIDKHASTFLTKQDIYFHVYFIQN